MSDPQTFSIPTPEAVARAVVAQLAEKGLVVPSRALDIQEAADYLGISTRTLRGLVEYGKIKAGNASLGTGKSANLVFSIRVLDKFSSGE